MTARSLAFIAIAALLAAAGIGGAYWVRLSGPAAVVRDVSAPPPGLLPARSEEMRTVPAFSFAESRGGTIGNEELRGKVWLADFIFTSCAGTCPAMTTQMRAVQDALESDTVAGRDDVSDDVRLVSFSVDPDRDLPEVLRAYAERSGAKNRWLFLRGPSLKVAELSRQGFLLGNPVPGLPPPAGTLPADSIAANAEWEPLAHDRHFALVDRQGRIRGYYDGVDPGIVPVLVRDIRTLLSEKPTP